MKNQGRLFCGVLLACQAVFASVLPNIPNEVTQIEQANVAIGGAVGRKMTALFKSRFMTDEARTVIYEEAENAFKTHFDDQYAPLFGWWQGEYWGKTMLSAAEVYSLTKDESLRRFLLEKAHAFLAAYQHADGYLGTYKDPKFLKSRHEKLHSQWCWNIWGRKYTIWALYEIYRQTGDRACLEAAIKSLDQMLDMMAEMRTRFVDTGSFYGLPSCSILKPLLLLYRETRKPAYLEAAKGIVADLDRTGNPIPNLVGNAFSDKPVHEWYPDPYFWAKAYETMSCMEGLIEYYRMTGGSRVFDAVKHLHVKLVSNELNPLMGVGYFDHFVDGAHRANAVTEPCDVIHWMRVNRELYILTGDAVCLDFMEKAFYNAFLAGVYRDGQWGAHAVRSHGSRHRPAPSQVGMKRHQCCIDNMPRGFADWAKTQLGRRRDGTVDVNFYSDVCVTDKDGVSMSISGNYPVSNVVTVRVAAATSAAIDAMPNGTAKITSYDFLSGAVANLFDSDASTLWGANWKDSPKTPLIYSGNPLVVVMRLAAGKTVTSFDISNNPYFNDYANSLTVESSADGVNWVSRGSQTWTGKADWPNWYGGSSHYAVNAATRIGDGTGKGSRGFAAGTVLRVDAGATLDTSLVKVEECVAAALEIDATAGCGTITDLALAENGVLNIVNLPQGASLRDLVLSFPVTRLSGAENLKSWTINVDGAEKHGYKAEFANGQLKFVPPGMSLIVK